MFELNFLKSVKTGDGTKQFSGDDMANLIVAYGTEPRLTRITGLLTVPLSLKCGGGTERGHSARDNETAEQSQKGKVTLA